jgi:hypothetical protein
LGPSAESQISQKARKLGGWEAIKLESLEAIRLGGLEDKAIHQALSSQRSINIS